MDFWEVIKVVVRRWVVTVPVLLLTIAVALLLPPRIDPAYAASSSTAVITPFVNDAPSNPFLAIGPVGMAQGLAATADSPSAIQEVVDAGGSPRFGVQVQNSRSAILLVEVEAPTPEQATETSRLVLDLIARQLSDRQTAAGAPIPTQYYTQDLVGEAVAVPVYDGAQRVRFLSIGLGVGLAVALALLLEGLAVMRGKRRSDRAPEAERSTIDERLALLEERERLLVERERLLAAREREEETFGRWAKVGKDRHLHEKVPDDARGRETRVPEPEPHPAQEPASGTAGAGRRPPAGVPGGASSRT